MRDKPSDITKLVLKKSKIYIIVRSIVCLIYRAIAIIIPMILSSAINEATNKNYNIALKVALFALLLNVVFRLFDILNTYTWHNLYNKMYERFTKIAIKETVNNTLYSLSRIDIGEFSNIMSTDINVICDFYCNLIMRTIRILEITVIFIYFFNINLIIGFIGILVLIISLVIIILFSKKIEKLNLEKSNKLDERGIILNEMMLSIKEIKSFNLLSLIENRVKKSTKEYTSSFKEQRLVEDMSKYLMVGFIEIVKWSLFIYSIYLVSKGNMEIGSLLIIYNYYGQLVDGFSEISTISIGIRQLKVSEKRFFKLAEFSHMINNSGVMIENLTGDIKFKNIVYGDKNNPIFNNISFSIKPNSINAIKGDNDTDVSGVADLLLKLNTQHEGVILLDGIDIRDILYSEYFDLVSNIDKEPVFFKMSIKDNLNIVSSTFNDCVEICKTLNIHDDIIKLKYGYDTILNSKHDTLKPIVKFKLYIAKVLLKNAKIIIFNKTLDNVSNSLLNEILNILIEKKKHHTIIFITSNKKILDVSDNIITLNNTI